MAALFFVWPFLMFISFYFGYLERFLVVFYLFFLHQTTAQHHRTRHRGAGHRSKRHRPQESGPGGQTGTPTPKHATRRPPRTARPSTAPQHTTRQQHNTQQRTTGPGAGNSADNSNSTTQAHQHSKAQHRTERGGQGTHSKTAQNNHSTKHSSKQQHPPPHHGNTHSREGRAHTTSSRKQCYAPTPRLGSLRAGPMRSHWRQSSSTGPAAPAARGTTHQGGGVVGKRLQPRLLSNALTGEWRNGEAGGGQGCEPREPGKLRRR